MDLQDLSATQLLALFSSCELSPLEYYDYLLIHIERWEPSINALYSFDPDRIRDQARAASARWSKGRPCSSLDGIPVTLKELIVTQGDCNPQGSRANALIPATEDAPPAMRMRESGAIILGKTTVPDFGMLSSGLSSLHGITRNPWDLSCNPGGSSAGAAAAGAAGYGPLHIGTDIGGSVRLPAGWCGLVGFKPTLGLIPIDPYYTGRCAGPMTRTVDDCALLMKYLAQPDSRDATSLAPQLLDWCLSAPRIDGLKIGLMLDPGCGLRPEPEVCDAVRQAAQLFEANGAQIEELAPLMNRRLLDGLDDFWRARQWSQLQALSAQQRSQVLPYIEQWAAPAARMSAVQAVEGFNQTFEMRRRCANIFRNFDLVLSPTNQISSFPAELPSPSNNPSQPFEHIVFTVPWNMGEQPALSINCGFTARGLPIGLQMVAPRFSDQWLLQCAKAYETWRGPIDCWPCPTH
ncbi:amidase [Pseudomonas sp. 5P_3.1_Bac2]|uniref:amidase n=1 Tax=Pseudomonas sp. 5P_3.1_Bac2 TaxID=2971617 RepID=UPI0021C818DB|nr:amidase [Pseudomonas sp. 5P_3.1_Bac2]MCU1719030.1 amidase [Pseudomonas sp. 5P_3.1_Bac2]